MKTLKLLPAIATVIAAFAVGPPPAEAGSSDVCAWLKRNQAISDGTPYPEERAGDKSSGVAGLSGPDLLQSVKEGWKRFLTPEPKRQ